jgi:thiol:disulfide interchange protein DsbA
MESAAVGARLEPAYQYAISSGVEGTPTVIVNGRYRVTGRTLDDILRITDHLIARERAAGGR